jgi:hypothetical protein
MHDRSNKEANNLPASPKKVSVNIENGGLPRRRPAGEAPSSRGVGKAKSFDHRGDFARGVRRNHSSAEKYFGTSRYQQPRNPNEVDGILKPQKKFDQAFPKVFTSKKRDKAKAKPAL